MSQDTKSFNDFEIGDEIGPVTKTPTTAMVLQYAEVAHIQGLKFFFHKKAAEQAGLTQPIVPGPLNTTYLCQMLKDFFVGWRLRTLNTTFRTPIRHGETISLWGMITEKNEEDGVPTVYCDLVVENEQGERAITGTAVMVQQTPRSASN